MTRRLWLVMVAVLLAALTVAPTVAQDDDASELVFGMVLVGFQNDRGWSQAHHEGGVYAAEQTGATMLTFEALNPANSPETTLRDVVEEMVDAGAELIFTTSDDFKDATHEVAREFPEIVFIHVSGDGVLAGTAPPNVGNVMGQMEWGKIIAGCAAALQSESGRIGYLGPLINDETRRLAASAYLGARYCWNDVRGGNPALLRFEVTWIGFWFNIPGVTLDPTEEANTLFDSGVDVLISGIDTTEAIVVAGQRRGQGEDVFAVPYDYLGACDEAPEACLGVPYFHWGPAYAQIVREVASGTWEPRWDWLGPDWDDINNLDTTIVGFEFGPGLTDENAARLEELIEDLADYATNPFTPPNTFALWTGPLTLQDGTTLAGETEVVDFIDVWYLQQLLQGMTGASSN